MYMLLLLIDVVRPCQVWIQSKYIVSMRVLASFACLLAFWVQKDPMTCFLLACLTPVSTTTQQQREQHHHHCECQQTNKQANEPTQTEKVQSR